MSPVLHFKSPPKKISIVIPSLSRNLKLSSRTSSPKQKTSCSGKHNLSSTHHHTQNSPQQTSCNTPWVSPAFFKKNRSKNYCGFQRYQIFKIRRRNGHLYKTHEHEPKRVQCRPYARNDNRYRH